MKAFTEAVSYLVRLWLLGWWMILKLLAASLIFSFFLIPLKFTEGIVDRIFEQAGSRWADVPGSEIIAIIYLACTAVALLVYVPFAAYVAASSVGFCQRIARSSTDDDETAPPQPVKPAEGV